LLCCSLSLGGLGIYPLRNIRALAGEVVVDENIVCVKNRIVAIIDVTDVADCPTHNSAVIESVVGGTLACDGDDVVLHQRLASDPACWILLQAGIQNTV